MSDEVKKAAERHNEMLVKSAELIDCIPYDAELNRSLFAEVLGNAKRLSRHVLAEHAADDDEPIDEAWLQSIGGEPDEVRVTESGIDGGVMLYVGGQLRGKYVDAAAVARHLGFVLLELDKLRALAQRGEEPPEFSSGREGQP